MVFASTAYRFPQSASSVISNSSSLRSGVSSLRPDWPAMVGALDLDIHDLPHESSTTEWWYYNTHMTCADGSEVSAFVTFFRICKHIDENGKKSYASAFTWALTDVASGEYICDSILDKDTPAMVSALLKKDNAVRDPLLRRAFKEMLEKGSVPAPDRCFKKKPFVSNSSLDIDYEG